MQLLILIFVLASLAFAQPYEPVLLYDELYSSASDLAKLGDQDGDGYDDILIGVADPDQDWDGFGHLRIVYGGESAPYRYLDFGHVNRDTSSHAYATFRSAGPSTCGDYNGDGHIDIMTQYATTSFDTRMFYAHGGPALFDTLWDWNSDTLRVRYWSLGGLGDYDGDGKMDYVRQRTVVPSTQIDFCSGAWPDLSDDPAWTYTPPVSEGHYFWGSLGRLFGQGDINGDGFADFAYPMWYDSIDGTPGLNFVLVRHGIWLGGPDAGSEPAIVLEHRIGSSQFVSAWQPLADVNGDGYDDMLAPLLQPVGEGFIALEHRIYYGGDPLDFEQHEAILSPPDGWSANDVKTYGKQNLGDISDDGYEDFALYWYQGGLGYYLFYLGGNPPSGEVAFVIGPHWNDEDVGFYIAPAGDFNHDGIDDFSFLTRTDDIDFRVVVIAGDPGFGLSAPEGPPVIAEDFHFGSPYPNPFNSSVSIPLELSKPELVDIRIYNILGQEVYNFGRLLLLSGRQELIWNGVSNSGTTLASGTYIIHARTADAIATTKLELLR